MATVTSQTTEIINHLNYLASSHGFAVYDIHTQPMLLPSFFHGLDRRLHAVVCSIH